MQVEALDRDERGSVNAELRFSLMEQTPRIPSSQMFFIDSITGEVSLTEEGQSLRVAIDFQTELTFKSIKTEQTLKEIC